MIIVKKRIKKYFNIKKLFIFYMKIMHNQKMKMNS